MNLQGAFDAGFELVKAYVDGELDDIRKRIAAVENRPTLRYCGVWDHAKRYDVGNFVTHDGSLWHAEIENRNARPGEASAVWKLAVKRGKDARS